MGSTIRTEKNKLPLTEESGGKTAITFMDSFDVITYLKISASTLYKLTHRRAIPFYKPAGKKIYFLKEEVDAWVR